jgi:hypothetical protein
MKLIDDSTLVVVAAVVVAAAVVVVAEMEVEQIASEGPDASDEVDVASSS